MKISFGKHKGTEIGELDDGHLDWLVGYSDYLNKPHMEKERGAVHEEHERRVKAGAFDNLEDEDWDD